ncbi:hypothetical protein [Phenylobacterium sp.]|uniref:hypothetical protein n=1 Tax=Phenylobacterium sp. TaxID=1871053 RepID=UPI002DEFF97B|nr:hypothetical protein [Phenylobacterium sp.]
MRTIVLAAAAAAVLGLASAAQAAPAVVDVAIGPQLQAKAEKTYGVRDVRDLANDLRSDVEHALARTGAYDGARIELVLIDAVPNRPTFKQLGDKPGLSYESFGLGGARIEGRIVTADGHETPVAYRDYETDIRYARMSSTWYDAQTGFDRFAHQLARGKALASR